MAASATELRKQLKVLRVGEEVNLEAAKAGLDYARDRFIEIESTITNEKIARLAETTSVADTLLFLALGGIAGSIASAATSMLLKRMLAGRLAYVRLAIDHRVPANQRQPVRDFFKMPKSVRVKSIRLEEDKFLNPNSIWGRLYRFVPGFVGSRLDELIQDGAGKSPTFWPPTADVADLSLQFNAWNRASELALRGQFADYDELIEAGALEAVDTAIADHRQLLSNAGVRVIETSGNVQQEIVERGRWFGESFLLSLVAKRYGPADNLASVKRARYPVKEKKSGGFEARYVDSWKSGADLVVRLLIKELVHPATNPPKTYWQYAYDDYPADESVKKHRLGQKAIEDRAAVELLGHLDTLVNRLKSSPVPHHLRSP